MVFNKFLFLILCTLLLVVPVFAQDVPDEIDDYDDDWEEVIEQLDDSGYLDEGDGELLFEDSRIRFDDDEFFFPFNIDDMTDFVVAATLQMNPEDEDEFSYCLLTLRDDADEGFLAVGLDSSESVRLDDVVFDSDDESLIEQDEHGEDVDEEIHVIVIGLGDEITVYVDGELFFEEDDLSVREGMMGLLRSEETDCDADDVWVWGMEGSGRDSSSDSGSSDLPDEIDDYDGASEGVIQQLIEAGVLGSGNAFLFGEDYAFIGASGSSFFPLGRGRNRTNVVLGGELTFNSQSSNYEQCGLLLRLDDTYDPTEDYLIVGIDSDGDLFLQNNSRSEEDIFDYVSLGLDLDDAHHLIIIARGESLSVYVNGELVLEDYEIYEERGIFGIGQLSDSLSSECTGRNIWVYDTPFFEPGVCNVLASGTVNRRSEPNTSSSIPGQLNTGETLQVEAQTEPGDGFIWYLLEDDSYIREDIISLVGDCNDLPEE